MQVRNKNNIGLPRRRPAAVALMAALASGAAFADEPSPWYIGGSVGLTHDSNVNRYDQGTVDPDGRGDTYTSVGLLGGFDQNYARQHFYAKGNIAYNKYRSHDYLSNTSYGLNAGWDWASIWNLSGGVNASANQSLAQLNGNAQAATLNQRNLLKSEQIGTNINWGGAGAMTVTGAFTHSRVGYSQVSQANQDSSANTGSLGLYYQVGPTLRTGVAYRLTRTYSQAFIPNAQTGANDLTPYTSDGTNIDLSADWRYTVQTGVNARLSFTRQTNSGGGGETFSGLTGSVAATYAPTGKLDFSLSYNRDAGTNGSFFNVPITSGGTTSSTSSTTSFYQNTQVANTIALGARYAATAKIGVTAGYSYRDAKVGTGVGATSGTYDDKLQTANLGATWAISRAWSLGCTYSHEKRNADGTPTYIYTANVIGCNMQATLQ